MKALQRYEDILKNKEKAKFLIAKESGILKEKINDAYKILEHCTLCERKCNVNRKEKLGFCRVGYKPIISSAFVHLGEEPMLVPSFTIFFMGCNFNCQYCQNYPISQWYEEGYKISINELSQIIQNTNCKNVNFVGGEPTPHLPFILNALIKVEKNIPIVWNSNFYMSLDAMDLLKGVVDVYLSDFKYGNNKCAERLSKVKNYFDVVSRNHLLASNDSEMIIRHLVLPNHFDCCTKPILEWIAENLGNNVVVNIMDQYRPCYNARNYKEINSTLKDECAKAIKLARELNLNFIF